jgi:hypothetical protein
VVGLLTSSARLCYVHHDYGLDYEVDDEKLAKPYAKSSTYWRRHRKIRSKDIPCHVIWKRELQATLRITACVHLISREAAVEYRISLTATYPSKLNQSPSCSGLDVNRTSTCSESEIIVPAEGRPN